jgi:nucleoside-diphosphate-sugar epimerase
VPRLVHTSTVNIYHPQPVLPWPEDTPYGPYPLWGPYAVAKIGCELALRERRPAPLSTVAIRFPLVLGPGNYIAREEFVRTPTATGAPTRSPASPAADERAERITAGGITGDASATTAPGAASTTSSSPP